MAETNTLGNINIGSFTAGNIVITPGTELVTIENLSTITPLSNFGYLQAITDSSDTAHKLNFYIENTSTDANSHVAYKMIMSDSYPADVRLHISSGSDAYAGIKFTFGLDQSVTGDPFEFGELSSTPPLMFDTDGNVFKKTTTAFKAYYSSTTNYVTGKGTAYTMFTGKSENFDINSNLSVPTFTAAISGKYNFQISLRMGSVDTVTKGVLNLVTSNKTYTLMKEDLDHFTGTYATGAFKGPRLLSDMDSADTATLVLTCSGASTDRVALSGGSGGYNTFFGCLVC